MNCYIMRGLPGSGKTSWVTENLPARREKDGRIKFFPEEAGAYCSADEYHLVNGEYKYDRAKAGRAHNYCLGLFYWMLFFKAPLIVVDNTNIRVFEFAPYYRLAETFGYQVQIVWVVASVDKCVARNVHGVPPETINRMARSFEPIPEFWNLKMVVKE